MALPEKFDHEQRQFQRVGKKVILIGKSAAHGKLASANQDCEGSPCTRIADGSDRALTDQP
jgi:hypothetical protein